MNAEFWKALVWKLTVIAAGSTITTLTSLSYAWAILYFNLLPTFGCEGCTFASLAIPMTLSDTLWSRKLETHLVEDFYQRTTSRTEALLSVPSFRQLGVGLLILKKNTCHLALEVEFSLSITVLKAINSRCHMKSASKLSSVLFAVGGFM